MNDKKCFVADLDDIQFRMSCGIDAVCAIHEAMETGDFTAESHLDALYGAYDHLHMLNDRLRQIVDGMCAEEKAVAVC